MTHKPVLLVEGARQVGKTTLVEHVLAGSAKATVRINLERDSLDRMAFDDCRDFAAFQDLLLDRHGFRPNADQILFIDEAQESRTVGGFVRFIKEEWARVGQPLAGWKRSPAGSEIDFIIKRGATATPVECKASLTVNLRHMRGLVAYLRSHGRRRGYITSLAPYAVTSIDDVQIVNLPAYLLERLAPTGRHPTDTGPREPASGPRC